MHNHNHDDEQNLAALLDLDAEVLGPQLAEATAWLAALAGDRPVRRILDLGCGTGAGTFALLERFPDADVIAVDLSAHMLRQLEAKARARGLAVRVRPVEANLKEAWPPLDGDVDLAWMSAALHHMSDPARTLRQALAPLRPGGVLGLVEMQGVPR